MIDAARRTLPLLVLATLFGAGAAGAQALQKRVDAKLAASPLDHNLWGIVLLDPAGKQLYGRNADRMFIPASNTKLVVSAVAAALLPPDWTVQTSVYADGPVDAGVLQGDLILYGRGDPTMGVRCYAVDTTAPGACDTDPSDRFRRLAGAMRAGGITTVTGDIIGDGSYFHDELVNGDWEAYDLNWWYAAPVSGLGFNDNSIDFTYAPGATVGAPATISFTPNFGTVAFENRTRTVPAGRPTTIDFYREVGTLRVWAEGDVALDSRGGKEYFALPDPDHFAASALRAALADSGIAVLGATRSTTDSMLYRAARLGTPLAEVSSRPVKDWIFPILNTSQNWFAEMLLKQLGRQFGGDGSWKGGLAVERRFLIDSMHVDSTEFALRDGSGLSSSNLVSPKAFATLLSWMRKHPNYPSFAAGLPQSGQRGSLRTRFVGTPLEGLVRAKTGSISRVNTLSGYIDLPGRTLAFSVQANNHTLGSRVMIPQIDSLVLLMGRK
ncbi:MAG TPA: D-alanyl-D-alanine carboxypeptidase/D-alanyl-D-alanine-endopeptidase [Gemmatimonadales bacterium]|nr:D-alanyl-D-alanine carboxypeptidase/D-alanyl-D-alanine-endopeptidase [Gemmatimonadales bacterium]